jgi:hypothetical protein
MTCRKGGHNDPLRLMTSERSLAYGRVMKTLEDLGPAKLHDLERQRVRQAADTLFFATPEDPGVSDALSDIEQLRGFLVDSGRWTGETAGRLAEDVSACGPEFLGGPVHERAA